MQKDMARLDAKQRAVYRMQGLPMDEGDEARITNILGDNCSITLGDDEVEGTKQTEPTVPPDTADRAPSWGKWALAGLLGASMVGGSSALTAYLLRQPQTNSPGGSVFRIETENPPNPDGSDTP